VPSNEEEELAPLEEAYERRTTQLYEARGALAEAVATLRTELKRRDEEVQARRAELAGLQERARNLETELDHLRARHEAELRAAHEAISALRGMKVVRWTAWPRSIVYRLRERGK